VADERRHSVERRIVPSIIASHLLRRISWEAVAGGTFLALAIQATMSVLAQALGMPATGEGSVSLWSVVTAVVSFLIAGWASARTASIPSRTDSGLQGLWVWAATVSLQATFFRSSLFLINSLPDNQEDALWLFFSLLAGAIAACVAGWSSAPHDIGKYPLK
jgi:hypothetical protein